MKNSLGRGKTNKNGIIAGTSVYTSVVSLLWTVPLVQRRNLYLKAHIHPVYFAVICFCFEMHLLSFLIIRLADHIIPAKCENLCGLKAVYVSRQYMS